MYKIILYLCLLYNCAFIMYKFILKRLNIVINSKNQNSF